jgi:predicted DNA-binding ribbon-helix-helix protein
LRQALIRPRLPTRYRPRNVFLGEFKTSVRLPPVMWEALEDIARHLGVTLQDLIRRIERDREQGQGLTDAIRIYIVEFYRARIKL